MNTALFPIPHPPRARPPQPPAQSLKPEDNEEYLNPEELGGMNPFHKSISSNGKTFPMPVVKPPIPNRKSDSVSDLLTKPWYSSKSDRRAAEVALRENGKDGAFLVRPSSGNNRKHPYTLVIFYRRKVYNIPIRFIDRGHQYGLGTEKAGEKVRPSYCLI
uniref:SH2 domain-containing protein n=1 Tax=Callorhinchus milii TaxID=7868 RepID=A0A4W3HVZ0_CALMI